jgi:transcriptional repressor NrdR
LKCPNCGYIDNKVLDSRSSEDGKAVRRRRECIKCSYRFTTYEKIEDLPIMVIKKSNVIEPFNKEKIVNGLLKACEKRPIPIEKIEEIANKVEQRIRNSMEKEVKTTEIGEMVIEYLKEIDEIAYVRFASVYRQFKDINVFLKEVNDLLK